MLVRWRRLGRAGLTFLAVRFLYRSALHHRAIVFRCCRLQLTHERGECPEVVVTVSPPNADLPVSLIPFLMIQNAEGYVRRVEPVTAEEAAKNRMSMGSTRVNQQKGISLA